MFLNAFHRCQPGKVTIMLEVVPTPPGRLSDAAPLERLPGDPGDDPFLRLAVAFLGQLSGEHSTKLSRRPQGLAAWCDRLGVDPLTAERIHVHAWIEHLKTEPHPTTGRTAAPASITRACRSVRLLRLGIKDAEVLTYSPVGHVRRPRVSDESSTVGLGADVRDYSYDRGHRIQRITRRSHARPSAARSGPGLNWRW